MCGITNSEHCERKNNENTANAELERERSKYNGKDRAGSVVEKLGDRLINDELKRRVSFAY